MKRPHIAMFSPVFLQDTLSPFISDMISKCSIAMEFKNLFGKKARVPLKEFHEKFFSLKHSKIVVYIKRRNCHKDNSITCFAIIFGLDISGSVLRVPFRRISLLTRNYGY